MTFSRRRGRPKSIALKNNDKGTKELIEKRKFNLTTEPLDLCFWRGLINEQQHNAGIRMRWLYTLKFGAPTISSYSPDNLGGHSCKYEDSGWLQRRQSEYSLIIEQLNRHKARKIIIDICVFSRMPEFLYKAPANFHKHSLSIYKELELLIIGLDEIDKICGTKKSATKVS
jgi:hypothetical protein